MSIRYSMVSTIKRILDHLTQALFYSNKDLEDIGRNLKKFRETIEQQKELNDPHIVELIQKRIDICEIQLVQLRGFLSKLTPDLEPTYDKLVSILRSLSACNVKSKYPKAEMEDLHNQLKEIQESLHQSGACPGIVDDLVAQYEAKLRVAHENSSDPQKLVTDLLSRCLIWWQVIKQRPGKIKEGFEDQYQKLLHIRNSLESRQLLQAWSMRETDLYSYQRQLDRIDESRTMDGNFVNSQGVEADLQTQRVCCPFQNGLMYKGTDSLKDTLISN
jgi:hypothetical protein